MVHPVSVLFSPYSLGMVHNIGPQRILPLVPIRSPKTPQKNRAYFGGERSQQILGLHFEIARSPNFNVQTVAITVTERERGR